MGFLKQFFVNVFDDESPAKIASGFEQLSESELEAHLAVTRYGDFQLTDAVRPSYNLEVVPTAGFRHDVYRDAETRSTVPVLMAAITKPRMMETFIELLTPLGDTVDVVLETSHSQKTRGHTDLYREQIELPILQSILWDFEDLLINDGCTGIAVLNPEHPAGSPARRAQAAVGLWQQTHAVREHLDRRPSQLPRGDAVHHRSRARPLDHRAVRPGVR